LDVAVRLLLEHAIAGVPTVVCAQRSVVLRLCAGLAAAFGGSGKGRTGVGRGGVYVLHLRGGGSVRMSAVERFATSA
jgi:hypothetical protein